MYLFTEFPAFTMFAISCHALFLSPEVIDEAGRWQNNSDRSSLTTVDNARFYYFVRVNIQGRVCLNVTIRDLKIKKCLNGSQIGQIEKKLYFCISLMSLLTEFPAFTMFAISCHALFLSPEVIDEENFAFKITFLFSYTSNNTTFSLSVYKGFVYFNYTYKLLFIALFDDFNLIISIFHCLCPSFYLYLSNRWR
jgi:hypothetical protein